MRIAERTGERWWNAELNRIDGESALALDHARAGEAERCFRDAVSIARRQDAKSLELRAATSLARSLPRDRRDDEARLVLADTYGSFAEGFDTADLKDAKALLEELS